MPIEKALSPYATFGYYESSVAFLPKIFLLSNASGDWQPLTLSNNSGHSPLPYYTRVLVAHGRTAMAAPVNAG
jgi:hypothetical protein